MKTVSWQWYGHENIKLQIQNLLKTFQPFLGNKVKLSSLFQYLLTLFGLRKKGKRSLLQISQHQKPKRTSKNLQTITTSLVPF
jgi:hypothetical protein